MPECISQKQFQHIYAPAAAALDVKHQHQAQQISWACTYTVAMMDPVIAADGHTYEHTAIQHWLQGSSFSPVTGDKMPHTRLVPNVLVKSALTKACCEVTAAGACDGSHF